MYISSAINLNIIHPYFLESSMFIITCFQFPRQKTEKKTEQVGDRGAFSQENSQSDNKIYRFSFHSSPYCPIHFSADRPLTRIISSFPCFFFWILGSSKETRQHSGEVWYDCWWVYSQIQFSISKEGQWFYLDFVVSILL